MRGLFIGVGALVAISACFGSSTLGDEWLARSILFVLRLLKNVNFSVKALYPGCDGSSSVIDIFWENLELIWASMWPAIAAVAIVVVLYPLLLSIFGCARLRWVRTLIEHRDRLWYVRRLCLCIAAFADMM